jgi:linoleoyl-CoA desaturase
MKITFRNTNNAAFFVTLKKRVDAYFLSNNLHKNGDWRMTLKTIVILTIFFTAYTILMADLLFNGWLALGVCVVLGMFTAFIGFNLAHDGAHGAFSSNSTVNSMMGYTFDMLGCSSYMWKTNHNIIHHTYTNIPDQDGDLEPVFFIRLSPTKKVYKIHRYQHLYAVFFYGLTSLSWVFKKDFSALKKTQSGNESKKHPLKDLFILFMAKIIYYFLFLILPLMSLHFAWWQVLFGFFMMHFVEGLTLAIVFQLAHVVENTDFPEPAPNGMIQSNWAIHQMATTSDFARKSKLATYFFGGLNFQIEHHLFPKICHIHYPDLSLIVEKTAREFGVPYNDYRTMGEAIFSHYKMLKKIGRRETNFSV